MFKIISIILISLSFNLMASENEKLNPSLISIKDGCSYGGWIKNSDSVNFFATCGEEYFTLKIYDSKGNLDDITIIYRDQEEVIIASK